MLTTRHVFHSARAAAFIIALCSCGPAHSDRVGSFGAHIVYGEDDRRDVIDVNDVTWRELALSAAVALIPPAQLQNASEGVVDITAPTLQDFGSTCPTEPFSNQPVAARCSGVLVDDDLVLTAAHCIRPILPCESQIWAFGYAISDEGAGTALEQTNLYRCREVVLRVQSEPEEEAEGRRVDFAFVQLDRPVRGDVPELATELPIVGANVTVIGYPNGLPLKVDGGAEILDARLERQDFIELTSDTFGGSSGSGVFDENGRLVAVLSGGGADWIYDPERRCNRSRVLETRHSPAEDATYAKRAITQLCELGWASERLCEREGSCGDGQCEITEARASCPEDCAALAPLELGSSDAPRDPSSRRPVGSCETFGLETRDESSWRALAILLFLGLCCRFSARTFCAREGRR